MTEFFWLQTKIWADLILDRLFYFRPKFSNPLFSIVIFGERLKFRPTFLVLLIQSPTYFKADFFLNDKSHPTKMSVGGSQRLVPYIREHLISRQVFIMVFCTGSFVSYSLALYLDQWILLHHWTKNNTKNIISDIPTEAKNIISDLPTGSPSSSLDNTNVHLGLFYVQDPHLMKGKDRVETNVYVQQYIQQHAIPVWVHMSRFIVVSAMIFQVYVSKKTR